MRDETYQRLIVEVDSSGSRLAHTLHHCGAVRPRPGLHCRSQQGVQEKNPARIFRMGYPQKYSQVASACLWKTDAA